MSYLNFGYQSGDGTGTNNFLSGRQQASLYQNDTGSLIYVDRIDLLGVTQAISVGTGTVQLAIYSAQDNVQPGVLMGVTNTVTSLALGDTSFTISGDPVAIPAGAYVWVAINNTGSTAKFFGVIKTAGSIEHNVTTFENPWNTQDDSSGNTILPVTVYGNTVGPGDPTNLRVNDVFTEPLTEGYPDLRANYVFSEPLTEGYPNLRIDYVFSEPLTEGYSTLRVNLVFTETLHPVPLEAFMSSDPLPGFGNSVADPSIPAGANPISTPLPGLAFSVTKTPMFSTKIDRSSSGNEVRNSLQEFPTWKYNLNYEFLEDRSGSDSSLRTLQGFWLSRRGAFDTWLFKDPDDYIQVDGWIGDADGAQTEFYFHRTMGDFSERIGQVDTVNTIHLYNDAVLIDPADYDIIMPNRIVFPVAPATGTLTASFQFYFVCRFEEDEAEFEKFMDKLWNLQTLEFRSLIQ